MKIYLGVSAAEIDRARPIKAKLIELGFEVTSTWIEEVDKVGSSNPRNATRDQRLGWSNQDLAEVFAAELIWFLVPAIKSPTRGGWVELGFMQGLIHCMLLISNTTQFHLARSFDETGLEAETLETMKMIVTTAMSDAHRHIVTSGDTLQSIFCALGEEFETDEQALAHIKELRETATHSHIAT